MKKLALSLSVAAITAGVASAHNHINTGFYLGAAVGYGASNAKLSGQNPSTIGTQDIGSGAANIGILGGYGYVTGCLYMGGEVGYTFENTKINSTLFAPPGGGQTQLKRNGYANVALRGGYLFTPSTMGYIRLGGNWGKWTLNDTLNVFTPQLPGSGSKNTVTFAPGAGLETAVHKNVYLRVEYNYEFGPSVTAGNPGRSGNSLTTSRIRSQSGKLGVAYKF